MMDVSLNVKMLGFYTQRKNSEAINLYFEKHRHVEASEFQQASPLLAKKKKFLFHRSFLTI